MYKHKSSHKAHMLKALMQPKQTYKLNINISITVVKFQLTILI